MLLSYPYRIMSRHGTLWLMLLLPSTYCCPSFFIFQLNCPLYKIRPYQWRRKDRKRRRHIIHAKRHRAHNSQFNESEQEFNFPFTQLHVLIHKHRRPIQSYMLTTTHLYAARWMRYTKHTTSFKMCINTFRREIFFFVFFSLYCVYVRDAATHCYHLCLYS